MQDAGMAAYQARFAELEQELARFIDEKEANESRWSWVSSGRVVLTPVLGVMTAIVVLSDASDLVGAISAIVTGLSSIPAQLFPDDRKRTGNKVLAAKAANLLERVKNRDDELSLAQTTPYQLLRQFRYELGVLRATSATVAAVLPFWELPPPAQILPPGAEGLER